MTIRRVTFVSFLAVVTAAAAATFVLAPGAGAGGGPLDLVVTTTDDLDGAVAINGECSDPCTLREAVAEARDNAGGGNITFAVDGVFDLDGHIEVNFGDAVTITGNGVDKTILESDPPIETFRGSAPSGRHFELNGADLSLENMALRDGSADRGGSIHLYNAAELSTDDVHFVDNAATGGGGAIYADAGSDTVDIRNTTFVGNEAEIGGALLVDDDTGTVVNSTFTANTAITGSAIWVSVQGSLDVSYSTFSQNIASGEVGDSSFQGFRRAPAGFTVAPSTIYAQTFGGQQGPETADISIGNSILEKLSGVGTAECAGAPITSDGANIVDDDSCGFSEALDVEGTPANVEPLQDNGGATFTMALGAASAAVDVDPALCKLNDQRDLPRNVDGDADGTQACDSGSYELQVTPTTPTDPPDPTTSTSDPDGGVDADTATPATPTVARPTFTG